MEMTYAALAKSLGISLKPISSASTTSSSANSLPGSALTQASSSKVTNEPSSREKSSSFSTVDSKNRVEDEKSEGRSGEDISTSEQRVQAPTKAKDTGNADSAGADEGAIKISDPDAVVPEDPGSDADAEGISDSDIASSRPSSPNLASAQESSLEENKVNFVPNPQLAESPAGSRGTETTTNELEGSIGAQTEPRETMSDEELHHAKVLVLDLLGWGVPPEYLLQRGISHALLYTVFTDLRLRLPDAIFEDCVKLVSAQS